MMMIMRSGFGRDDPPCASLADMTRHLLDSDAPAETADKAKALFGDNYSRLQALKQRYDPDNVFSKWFAIKPEASA